MIVWGGSAGSNTNTGGRVTAQSNVWQPTSLGANVPSQRRNHSAIWTGGAMIVWGGVDSAVLNTGGIYTVDAPGAIGNSLRIGKAANLNLSWGASTDTTSYYVQRCNAPCSVPATIATANTNSYFEPLNTTSNFYAIESVNACGVTP